MSSEFSIILAEDEEDEDDDDDGDDDYDTFPRQTSFEVKSNRAGALYSAREMYQCPAGEMLTTSVRVYNGF